MPTTKPTVILVTIERLQDWFVAKSTDLRGLSMAAPDLSSLIADIPATIGMLYQVQHGASVEVRESSGGDTVNPFPLRYMVEPTGKAA